MPFNEFSYSAIYGESVLKKTAQVGDVKMVNVYPKEYIDKYEVKEEKYEDRKERDRRARELRIDGWTVECSKFNCPFSGGSDLYFLNAERERRTPNKSNAVFQVAH